MNPGQRGARLQVGILRANRYFVAHLVHRLTTFSHDDPSMSVALDRTRPGIIRVFYGVYAWAAFITCLTAAVLVALLVPGMARRRRWIGACARGFFTVAGIDGRLLGLEHLPEGHCVVVANHASYLDGVILQGFLPPRFAYVIKSEMKKIPLAHFLLRRIGSRFVERFHTAGSARDARNLLRAADAGQSLAFFPEGTFILQPGLGKFRLGAFATAIKAETPLVPVVISGSRAILPMGRFLPIRGDLTIQIIDPVMPDHPAFARHRLLAEEARRRMLGVLDEPDLVTQTRA